VDAVLLTPPYARGEDAPTQECRARSDVRARQGGLDVIVVKAVTWPFRFVGKMAARSVAMAVLSVALPLVVLAAVVFLLMG
jgi:hypothetical protein